MNDIVESIAVTIATQVIQGYENGYYRDEGEREELFDVVQDLIYEEVITLGPAEAFDAIMDADLEDTIPAMVRPFDGIAKGSPLSLALSLVYEAASERGDEIMYNWSTQVEVDD